MNSVGGASGPQLKTRAPRGGKNAAGLQPDEGTQIPNPKSSGGQPTGGKNTAPSSTAVDGPAPASLLLSNNENISLQEENAALAAEIKALLDEKNEFTSSSNH
ncbi:hypothetical protein V2J09_020324 [Rumex salicifolius]